MRRSPRMLLFLFTCAGVALAGCHSEQQIQARPVQNSVTAQPDPRAMEAGKKESVSKVENNPALTDQQKAAALRVLNGR